MNPAIRGTLITTTIPKNSFYATCKNVGIPEGCKGQPRLHAPKIESWGGRIGALVDPDGTLVRLIQI
jgi:hypothetical protein